MLKYFFMGDFAHADRRRDPSIQGPTDQWPLLRSKSGLAWLVGHAVLLSDLSRCTGPTNRTGLVPELVVAGLYCQKSPRDPAPNPRSDPICWKSSLASSSPHLLRERI